MTLTTRYRLVNHASSEFDYRQFRSDMDSRIQPIVCDELAEYLSAGASLHYDFFGNDGLLITISAVDSGRCPSRSAGVGDRLRGGDPIAPAEITSLAVLPLDNLRGDPEQDYFVDGMTEALITELSQIASLRVTSYTSVMRYNSSDKS